MSAVKFPPATSLQILAGPGTGKTRVLTSRVVELILSHSYPPSSICAVTFTRRASREMKDRLRMHLGADAAELLKLGTFHSVCANFLRIYGLKVDVNPNFMIWDDEDCELLLKYTAESLHKGFKKDFPADEVHEMFSRIKERTKIDPKTDTETAIEDELKYKMFDEYSTSAKDNPLYQSQLMYRLFCAYSTALEKSGALDFIDLLIKGLDLLRVVPPAQEISRIKHVLVDEFQDTSSLQYLIVKELFKVTKGAISAVGDPDQSIYGWRGADNTVFQRMKQDIPSTKEIYLEENYRSTASILAFANNMMSQDKTRPAKTLFTPRSPKGPKPFKKGFPITSKEDSFIVQEINRLVEKSEGVIGYGDCAVLFRENQHATGVSRILQEAGIPNRQLPELSLIDRPEVKNLLAFLRLAINDAHTPMLIRAMKGPFDTEDKVITELINRSVKHKITLFEVLQRLQSGRERDTNPSSIAIASSITQILHRLRRLRQEGASPVDLLHYIIEATNYHKYLMNRFEKSYTWRARGVQQTIQYARNFKGSQLSGNSSVLAFLDAIRDFSRPNNLNTGKVTLLTSHSAKGLEWPVIFIPYVVDGVYPHRYSNRTDEERRLLYVSCTRAQCLLYLTHSKTKMVGRGDNKTELQHYESPFTERIPMTLHQDEAPLIDKAVLDLFRDILGRVRKSE